MGWNTSRQGCFLSGGRAHISTPSGTGTLSRGHFCRAEHNHKSAYPAPAIVASEAVTPKEKGRYLNKEHAFTISSGHCAVTAQAVSYHRSACGWWTMWYRQRTLSDRLFPISYHSANDPYSYIKGILYEKCLSGATVPRNSMIPTQQEFSHSQLKLHIPSRPKQLKSSGHKVLNQAVVNALK